MNCPKCNSKMREIQTIIPSWFFFFCEKCGKRIEGTRQKCLFCGGRKLIQKFKDTQPIYSHGYLECLKCGRENLALSEDLNAITKEMIDHEEKLRNLEKIQKGDYHTPSLDFEKKMLLMGEGGDFYEEFKDLEPMEFFNKALEKEKKWFNDFVQKNKKK